MTTTDHAASSRPDGCDVGIVFALAVEADAFARRVTGQRETRANGLTVLEGAVAGGRVAWCVGGSGPAAAGRATRLMLAGHRPRLLVSAGFCGGLVPALVRGQLVEPGQAVLDGEQAALGLATTSRAGTAPVIVTVATVVPTAAAKQALARRTGAQLVDMETHAVARAALAVGVPCAAVRVVSDDAATDLAPELASLGAPQSALRRLGRAVGAVARRPRAAADLWGAWERAVIDGRTLGAALVDRVAAARVR